MPPKQVALVRLRIGTPLTGVSLIYAGPLRALAAELTGKPNLQGLYAWCAKRGVGVDGFTLTSIPGGLQGQAWLDADRQRGVFLDRVGNVVARMVGGKLKGDPTLAAWLDVLPATAPAGWGAQAPAAASPPKAAARATPTPPSARPARASTATLTARVVVELRARAQVATLTPTQRKQLSAAAKELCGAAGLPGKTRLNGLTISQGDVAAGRTAARGDVEALQRAMRKLKAPRAPAWKG